MTKIEKIIVEHIRLAAEFANMPINGGDTEEQALVISRKKVEIKNKIKKLKEELLFEQYLEMQSKEWKEDIINWESFNEPGKDISVKVNFTWGWLRVYRTKNNQMEWY